MSKVLRVVVLCPNARRQTVNLTPNSSVLQILEESCKKQNLNPDDFDIYHYNKPLDLSLPVRFANLANNAQLELKPAKNARKDSLVTIGLQLESGERIMKDFVPSISVWDVVEQCLSMHPEKNCDNKGEPVCIYMRQKLIGDELKNTTLRSLGLTKGSAIIRLLYRNPDDLTDQAHISSPLSNLPKALTVTANSQLSGEGIDKNSTDKISTVECNPALEISTVQSKPKDSPISNSSSAEKLNEKNEIAFSGKGIALRANSPNEVQSEPKDSPILNENTSAGVKSVNQNLPQNSSSAETPKEKNEIPVEKENKPFNAFSGRGIALRANNPYQDIPKNQKMEIDSYNETLSCDEDIGAIHYIGDRHAVLYSLDDVTDVKKADLPDEFFELTIDDVKYLMEEYKKSRLEMENKPLLTKELRDRRVLRTLGRYKQTVIRTYFPEKLVLQAVFEATETVQDVFDFLKEFLEDRSLDFYLYTTPPKEKKDPSKSLIESMLIPAAVVYFGSEKLLPRYLDKSLRDKISDPRAATLAAYESRQQAISDESEDMVDVSAEIPNLPISISDTDMSTLSVPGPSTARLQKSSEKVPKWLKLSRFTAYL